MKFFSKYFSGLTRNTVLLAFSSFFADISTEMLYPILPIFLIQTLHTSGSVVGLIEGIAQATQNITQGFSGWISDRLRNRKSIALVGYLLAAISKPLLGLSVIWPEALGARFLDRFGTGMRSAPRDALIAASVSKENRGKAFGLEGIGDNLGAFLGPLLAILLLLLLQVKIRYIFYLAFIPSFLAFLTVLFVKETHKKITSEMKLDLRVARLPKSYWNYLLVVGLLNLGNSSNAFLILQTQAVDLSLQTTILIYAFFNLIAAVISYPAGYLSDIFGRKHLLLVSFIIFFLSYLGFALTHNILVIGFLFILYGLYQGIFRSVGKALAVDHVPAELHASALGWYSSTIGILQLVASLIGGLLWDHVGHAAVFYFGAFFAVLGAIALIVIIPRR